MKVCLNVRCKVDGCIDFRMYDFVEFFQN
jgi:hypothetical protein